MPSERLPLDPELCQRAAGYLRNTSVYGFDHYRVGHLADAIAALPLMVEALEAVLEPCDGAYHHELDCRGYFPGPGEAWINCTCWVGKAQRALAAAGLRPEAQPNRPQSPPSVEGSSGGKAGGGSVADE